MVQKRITGWKLWALNAVIALHLYAMFFWGLPDSPFRNRMARPVEKYVVYTGLWHIWGMFAPGPLDMHFDVSAEVKYQDGTKVTWMVPRPQDYPIFQRTGIERYRKWRERIKADDFRMIWDDAAHYVARLMNKNPNNPPVEVKWTRFWIPIPRPIKGQDYQPMPAGYTPNQSFTYATFPITAKDLQ
jgi:hypothetical protein